MNVCRIYINWSAIKGGCISVVLLFSAMRSSAIIYYSTGNSSYNTTAPTGSLADSGWQFEGYWNGSLGTLIGANYFVSAKHISASVGNSFNLGGTNYATTAVFYDPSSDLAIWRIDATFSSWAPLYTQSDEIGKPLVVFGSGVQRGGDIMVDSELKGWGWGAGDGLKRWGENVVSGTTYSGGPLLYADFDANGGPNEAHLAIGDSGGGVFIQQGSTWALAGVNYAVDGLFDTTNTGSGFNAALFDAGGLYIGNSGNWHYITNQIYDIPSSFYSTRISERISWINSIIIPEASTVWMVVFGAGALLMNRRRSRRRGDRAGAENDCRVGIKS